MIEDEYKGSLKRAFEGNDSDFITLDGHSCEYLRNCTQWALDKGYLKYDEHISGIASDSQWTVMCYRLTDTGKAFIKE